MEGCLTIVVAAVVFIIGLAIFHGCNDEPESLHDWTYEHCQAVRVVALSGGINAEDAAVDYSIHC